MPSIEQLESMLESDPDDTFLLYALAMELGNCDQHDRSLQIFNRLMQQDPPYVPAFFMSGQQLVRIGRVNEARKILSDGIVKARSQNDLHAAGEMTEFLASISD